MRFTRWIVVTCAATLLPLALASSTAAQSRELAGRTTWVPAMSSSVAPLRQTVTLSLDNVPLRDALRRVADQARMQLWYSDEIQKTKGYATSGRVSLHVEQMTVREALTRLLEGTGLEAFVSLNGTELLVRAVPGEVRREQTGGIVGRVIDGKTQTVLAGATVLVLGTNRSATTGSDGRYRVADVPAGPYTVRARYIGYAPGTTSVTVSADQEATADFTLEKSAQRLDEVVTTGTVVPTEVKALPSPVTVITGDEIRAKHVQRITELFRGDVPGVFSWDPGDIDDQSSINVRGASSLDGSGNVKTYVDGVELESGSFRVGMIDPSTIDRIELIRGPQASTIYGAEALNGVLQIFTKKGSNEGRPVVQGRIASGAIQTQWADKDAVPMYVGNASISGGTGTFSYDIGAARSYRGEWVPHFRDGENSLHVGLSGGQAWLTVELTGRLNWQARSPAYDPFSQRYFPPFPPTDLNYRNAALGTTLKARPTRHWEHSLTFGIDRNLQEYISAPGHTDPSDTLVSITNTESMKFSVLYSTTLEGTLSRSLAGNLTAGANVTSYNSTYLAGRATTDNGPISSFSYGGRNFFTDRGYFTQGQLSVAAALFLTAGVRVESNDEFGRDYGLAWSPRAGMSYVHALGGATLKARFSYGKSIRPAGTFVRDGAVYPFAIYLPNQRIGPETQHGADLGIDVYASTKAALQATYYNQTAGDLIDQVLIAPGATPQYQYQNVGEIKNTGLELQGSLSPVQGFTLTGSYTIASSRVQRLSPSYTGDLNIGDQLLGIPKHTVGGTLTYAGAGWTGSLGALHSGSWTNTDRVALYDSYFNGVPYRGSGRAYWITYPGFTKLRLSLGRQLRAGITAFLNADNLTNSYSVEYDNSRVTTGRVTTAGLDFRF